MNTITRAKLKQTLTQDRPFLDLVGYGNFYIICWLVAQNVVPIQQTNRLIIWFLGKSENNFVLFCHTRNLPTLHFLFVPFVWNKSWNEPQTRWFWVFISFETAGIKFFISLFVENRKKMQRVKHSNVFNWQTWGTSPPIINFKCTIYFCYFVGDLLRANNKQNCYLISSSRFRLLASYFDDDWLIQLQGDRRQRFPRNCRQNNSKGLNYKHEGLFLYSCFLRDVNWFLYRTFASKPRGCRKIVNLYQDFRT